MPPLREIPRPPSSRAASRPRTIHVTSASPEFEADFFSDDLGDPAAEPITFSPIGWVADQASAAARILANAGRSIYDQVVGEAQDLGATITAAVTGIAPAEPGPLFTLATGLAESVTHLLPEAVQKRLSRENPGNIAGYITLPDGRRIPVPKAEDSQGQGERALSELTRSATVRANADVARERIRAGIERDKLEASTDRWQAEFALKERAAAQQERLGELKERALKEAVDQQTLKNRGPGWWTIGSRLEVEPPSRRIRTIGPGVAGGISFD